MYSSQMFFLFSPESKNDESMVTQPGAISPTIVERLEEEDDEISKQTFSFYHFVTFFVIILQKKYFQRTRTTKVNVPDLHFFPLHIFWPLQKKKKKKIIVSLHCQNRDTNQFSSCFVPSCCLLYRTSAVLRTSE